MSILDMSCVSVPTAVAGASAFLSPAQAASAKPARSAADSPRIDRMYTGCWSGTMGTGRSYRRLQSNLMLRRRMARCRRLARVVKPCGYRRQITRTLPRSSHPRERRVPEPSLFAGCVRSSPSRIPRRARTQHRHLNRPAGHDTLQVLAKYLAGFSRQRKTRGASRPAGFVFPASDPDDLPQLRPLQMPRRVGLVLVRH